MNNNLNNNQQNNMNTQRDSFNTSGNPFNENNSNTNFNNYNNANNSFTGNNSSQNIDNYNHNLNNQFSGNNTNQNFNNINFRANKTEKNKMFKIAIGIIAAVVFLLIIKSCGNSSLLKTHKNTTGSFEYKDSDVDLNCTYNSSNGQENRTAYTDFIFNYKSGNSKYQLKTYTKMILEYPNGLTDEKYKEFIKSLDSLDCLSSNCTSNHLELSTTSLGWDTKVDRIGNKIEVTFNSIFGKGYDATNDDIEYSKNLYESKGYKCS